MTRQATKAEMQQYRRENGMREARFAIGETVVTDDGMRGTVMAIDYMKETVRVVPAEERKHFDAGVPAWKLGKLYPWAKVQRIAGVA